MKKLAYRAELNGIRGLAILSVVVYHYNRGTWIPGGFLGVDLFFVLSGFLITTLLVNEWDSSGTIAMRAFYRRRALRVFPALAVMLVFAVALAVAYRGHARHEMVVFVVATAAYVANFAQVFGAPVYWAFTWSLAAEEQFYMAWPATLRAFLKRNVNRDSLAAGLVIAALLSWVFATGFQLIGARSLAFYSPLTRAEGILCGATAGLLFASGRLPKVSPRLGFLGLLAYALAVFTVGENSPLAVIVAVPIAAAGGTLLACAANEGHRAFTWLAWKPLVYVGTISYAAYLWNSIVFDNLHGLPRVLGIPVTLAFAGASMQLVEQRFLAMKRARSHPRESMPGRKAERTGGAAVVVESVTP